MKELTPETLEMFYYMSFFDLNKIDQALQQSLLNCYTTIAIFKSVYHKLTYMLKFCLNKSQNPGFSEVVSHLKNLASSEDFFIPQFLCELYSGKV